MKTGLLLALALLLPVSSRAGGAGDADQSTIKMVEFFLRTPVAELPTEHIDDFLAVDPNTVPKKLRQRFKAKCVELYAFKREAEGKKRGTLRTPEPNCDAPKEGRADEASVLMMAGYVELFEDDLLCVEKETKCTPHDLMCEFTLQSVVEIKGKKKNIRYFMHQNDIIMGIVAGCRGKNGVGKQTNFFGTMKPLCQR